MKLKRLALFLIAAVLPVIAYTVKAQSNTVYDPAPLDTIYPIKDDSARALVSLAAMYAPMESESGWARLVCENDRRWLCLFQGKSGARFGKVRQATSAAHLVSLPISRLLMKTLSFAKLRSQCSYQRKRRHRCLLQ
jgi:hypothetical protein